MTYLSHCEACSYGSSSIIEAFIKYCCKDYDPFREDTPKTLETVIDSGDNVATIPYQLKSDSNNYSSTTNKNTEYFTPYIFLKEHRPFTQFIGEASEIELLVHEIFKETTGRELPSTILFTLCSEEQLREIHKKYNGKWSHGIMGFCVNRAPFISSIFVRKGNLDSVIVTLGHEIGHALCVSLNDAHDEEAKAFAFCFAWLETIKNKNLGNLADCIEMTNPAQNGLHNVALEFVKAHIAIGKKSLDLFKAIKSGSVSMNKSNNTF